MLRSSTVLRSAAGVRACNYNAGADLAHPDSTFVEDTAVLTARSAVLTRPGARSREGEVAAMRPALRSFFPAIVEIESARDAGWR